MSETPALHSTVRAWLLDDAVRPLLAVIASPANWSMATLPRALKPEQVERVLNSFTRTRRSPKRGYAIVRLALDLGLRIGEIARLQLDDIDWKLGTVILKRTKSRRQDVLPLPLATGMALEDYPQRAAEEPQPGRVRAPPGTARSARGRVCHPLRRAPSVRARGHPARPHACPAPHGGVPTRRRRQPDQGSCRRAAPPLAEHRQLGWVGRGAHGAPRIHDLRHAFAVRRLLQWHQQGVDVHQRMLALSTYLGHAKVSNTYWYLSGVPELMGVVGKRFEHFVDPWEDIGEEDGHE